MLEISIILPCYNLEDYIERCLQSIASQNYDKKKFEVIIVFDSCTDNSQKICGKILNQGGLKYKFLSANVRSAGIARNIGLDAASGKFIWFIDGDDYLVNNNAFSNLISYCSESDVNAVYMRNVETDCTIHDDFAAWRYFYKRDIIGEIRFGNEKINEDWIFTKKVVSAYGYKELVIEDKLYHYTYPRAGSVMDTYFKGVKNYFTRI